MTEGNMTEPTPLELWRQADGDGARYRELMREHGYLVPGKPEPLPCGWPAADELPGMWERADLEGGMADTQEQTGLFCGCCGNEIGRSTRSDPDWCQRCKPHVLPATAVTPRPPWERTYHAKYGRDCPYQVGTENLWGEHHGVDWPDGVLVDSYLLQDQEEDR